MRTAFRAGAALLLGVAVIGCGSSDKPKLVPVTGKVVNVKKGEPVTAGSIYFTPDAGNAYQGKEPGSLLQTDGTFTMKSYPHGEGVPPGAYKVTLDRGLAGRLGKADYGDPAKTPLKIVVGDDGVKDHVFEVK
jgi:hypothetical protein